MSDIVITKITRAERMLSGSWLDVIASNLDYHRATFLWKCEGLSEAQLRQRPMPTSELTLLGLMRHLQGVERYWFQQILADTTPACFPYRTYEMYGSSFNTWSRSTPATWATRTCSAKP